MPNMGFGLTAGGYTALRIAYDNATDLVNEPASNRGKFQFDSFNTQLGYVYNIYVEAWNNAWMSGGYLGYAYYFLNGDTSVGYNSPSSAFYNTCGALVRSGGADTSAQIFYYFSNWWNFGYMPIVETRTIDPNLPANTFAGAQVRGASFNNSFGFVDSMAGYASGTSALADGNIYGNNSLWREAHSLQVRAQSVAISYLRSVLQLPIRDDPLPNFATTPVSGQVPLMLNATTARLALPGYDITDTNLDHFILHEDKIPAKIMRAGDVTVPASSTVDIVCPLPLTPLTYMDFHARRVTEAEFWHPPFFDSINSDKTLYFQYTVKTDRVTISNTNTYDIVIRYVICADSDQVKTTGGKKVFLQGNDGTRDYVQIKRPGSSDLSPNLNDIMVDTRLAYMPILAQGFLSWTTDFPTVITGSDLFKGERMATVTYNNPSPKLLPFVKQSVVLKSNCSPVASRQSYHKVFTNAGSWSGRSSQDSTWANLHESTNSVDFYMAGGNPLAVTAGGTVYNTEWPSNANTTALGLRYYIFGIPASL